ncbi:unnamed protein product [Toxocara canis]|uniref:Zf-LYAR domain-containing protein n=1 Tax=Toxocara canis TaxID=6265 RepID=A0A183V8L4_TOXCA|nr:unnamed protein product [Toxocara canis]
MVFFNCDRCGDALKKNQIEKHKFKCRSSTYSCIDCNAVFTSVTYKDHLKCISEDQKYGGKNFVQKENKGEIKQNQWVEQVERAIKNVHEPAVKNVLEQIRGFANIPRKEAKFINFLLNSIRIRDRSLCSKAWKCIADEAKRMREEEEKQKQKEAALTKGVDDVESFDADSTKEISKETVSNGHTKEEQAATGECSAVVKSEFKWKKAIKRTLKEEGGEMKLKKLRKTIIDQYLEGREGDEDMMSLREKFDAKLSSVGVVIDGKLVRLS